VDSLTDQQLLRDYAEGRSEPAFAELVRRYIDLVYSAALRMVRDAHRAEDVTQAVFVALARSARPLAERPVLSGWLHRTAQNLAANTVRSDVRRRVREQEAAAMNELLSGEPDVTWEDISPHLDASLGELSEAERDLLLLRYFQRKPAREMAQALGVSEDAAQKRVSRAVERLRELLAKRGVTVGASGLAAVISVHAVPAAPVGLAATVSAAAIVGATAVAATTAAATPTIAMTLLQKTLVTSVLVAAVGTGLYEARQVSALRTRAETLQQQQAPLAEQVQQLTRQRDEAARRLATLGDENERLTRNTTELLRLRAETGMLRLQTNRLEKLVQALSTANASPTSTEPTNLPRDSWTFSGLATPEATLRTYLWAKSRGDVKAAFTTTTPEFEREVRALYFQDKSEDEISAMLMDSAKNETGINIVRKLDAADDQVILQVRGQGMPEGSYSILTLKKLDGDWKVTGAEERVQGWP